MEDRKSVIEGLCQFLSGSHSSFHAVRQLKDRLLAAGYRELSENRPWQLQDGGGYFVTRNSSSLLAFRIPACPPSGAHIIAVHSDSPVFKLKPQPELAGGGDSVRLNIEKYGGMLTAPWFDRPLTIAGRVLTEEAGGIRERLVYADRDLLLIPSLAIHMDREANDKAHSNVQTEMLPLFGSMDALQDPGELRGDSRDERARAQKKDAWKGAVLRLLAEEAGVQPEMILGADIYLTTRMQPSVWGASGEYISSPKLDDLECCYAAFRGFLESGEEDGEKSVLPMFCVFDNEETGSRSGQGAESDFLAGSFRRICAALGMNEEERAVLQARSFMLSADNAHAVHPNYPEKADPVNRPLMNRGIVLKHHANQKYTTDGISAAVTRSICRRHGIPLQDFSNRSDMNGGSTLGNISNTQLSMRTADIGLAQLSMHSCYETGGTKDPVYLRDLAKYFYTEKLPEVTAE